MKIMDVQSKAQDSSDQDFVWEDYLEDSKSIAAPPEAFTHVEHSLESVFKIGMQLEIPNPDLKDSYWRASVIMTCGELLSLRYVGFGEDRSCDFWFNVKSGEFHHAGWCKANSKKLFPPKVVLEKYPDYSTLLESDFMKTESVPAGLENRQAACMPIEQIKCGMKVEIANEHDPGSVWIGTILQNVGGRLLLRYDGLNDNSSYDFWMFYLCDRLYYVGYAEENDMKYSVPTFLKSKHSEDKWKSILKESLNFSEEAFPAHILEPKTPLEDHGFQEGMKLEAVDIQNYCNICPATVSKVINNFYFLVTIDSYNQDKSAEKTTLCCNSNTQIIFPINWAEENGLDLSIPKGYELKTSKFIWKDYLKFCNAVAASSELFPMCFMNSGFQNDMKLEAVDPLNPNKIYAATVEKIVEPIMFLSFDVEQAPKRHIITGINSLDIYPVGWCASNGYPLHTPAYHSKHKNIVVPPAIEHPEKSVKAESKVSSQEQHGKCWCPRIYFNHRCFTGPLLSKSRLAELPKAIGPGSVNLVMNEVLSRVVNIAYKSSRVLQLLQAHGKPSPGMQQQVVKAKYKGKSYRATIDVVQNSAQVEDFCKEICKKLECCPYLFGPKLVEEVCPSNCYTQTKTKFGYNFVKKHKKPGRPPLTSTSVTTTESAEVVKRGPGRKKKRKHWTQLLAESENSLKENISKREESSAAEEESDLKPDNEPQAIDTAKNNNATEQQPVKKKLKHIPSSNIVTRGAKLPNFGLWHHHHHFGTSFHSRRGRPRTRPMRPFPPRKVGRPLGSTKKVITIPKVSEDDDTISSSFKEEETKAPAKVSFLKSNPKDWTIEEVEKFILETDCAPVASLLKEQEIDGQALLMLDIFSVQQFLNLKPEPAEKFCHLIRKIKLDFFKYFERNI